MSLKDVFDKKPDWDRHESDTWKMLAQGKIPIFMAAQSLHRTLTELTNLQPAYRSCIRQTPVQKACKT
ncbi:hypothetical protein [Seongchinamella sediminis]|uniref:HTH domain-containing protein n=1 Tax=Seongchinamella sediminis TaxID=2283635 RepID=UPI003B82CB8B